MSTLVYPAANNTIELLIDDRSRQDGGTAARRHIGADIVELLRLPLVRLLPRGTHRHESLPEQQDPVTHTRASVPYWPSHGRHQSARTKRSGKDSSSFASLHAASSHFASTIEAITARMYVIYNARRHVPELNNPAILFIRLRCDIPPTLFQRIPACRCSARECLTIGSRSRHVQTNKQNK